MARAPMQVLLLPYRKLRDSYEYLVFHRSDHAFWQGIAGGAEDTETPLEAVKREAFEEAAIPKEFYFWKLDSFATVPAGAFRAWKDWPSETYVVPEHCFAVDLKDFSVQLSVEHTDCCWCDFEEASELLKWDSNKNALWELNQRLTNSRESASV